MDLLTPREVRRLLDVHGLAPRRSSGQNFVVEPNTVRKIVRDAGVSSDDVVLEVGPGLGSLTLGLATVAREVVAVEIDAGLVRALDDVVGGLDNVVVVHGDVLALDLREVLGGRQARLVANLPYNIATPVVFSVLDADVADSLYVMVQREVGERWAAQVGEPLYGAVSVKLALISDVAVADRVPRTVFFPVPHVDSVMVRLQPRAHLDRARHEQVRTLVDAAFAQRRKTLRNNLAAVTDPGRLAAALRTCGLDPNQRAEELTPEEFVRLTEILDAGGTTVAP